MGQERIGGFRQMARSMRHLLNHTQGRQTGSAATGFNHFAFVEVPDWQLRQWIHIADNAGAIEAAMHTPSPTAAPPAGQASSRHAPAQAQPTIPQSDEALRDRQNAKDVG